MNAGVLENENTQIAEDWLEFLVAREACAYSPRETAPARDLQAKLQDLEQKLEDLAQKQVQFRLSVERMPQLPAQPPQYCAEFPASFVPTEVPAHSPWENSGLPPQGSARNQEPESGPNPNRKGRFIFNLFGRKS
jgi:hypothetical protein